MKLSTRDTEILKVCYEQQILSLAQVSERFFDGALPNASRRITELTEGGYLKPVQIPGSRLQRLFRVGNLGQSVARSVSPIEVPQRKKFGLSTLEHDLLITTVRWRLLQAWDGVWIPEKVLKASEYPRIPDGLLLFPSGKKIAVELEITAKGKERYLRLWKKWLGTDVLMVLYIVPNPTLAALLRKYLCLAPRDIAFGLVEWDSLKNGNPLIWTPRGDLDLLNRREF